MKNKKLQKKLVLNKKTVSNLGDREMDKVKGGKTELVCECTIPCPALRTDEFYTCVCTYYCSNADATCPSRC